MSAFGFPAGQEAVDEGVLNLGTKDQVSRTAFDADQELKALLSQRQALKWVNQNIYNFGGDASKVTLWGTFADL